MFTSEAGEVEECWALIGSVGDDFWWADRCVYRTGQPYSVSFDHDFAIQVENDWENGTAIARLLGWVHTHPGFSCMPSPRDVRTMQAWCLSFGRPLLCVIMNDTECRAWWCDDDESPLEEAPVERIGDRFLGKLYSEPAKAEIESWLARD